MSTIHGFLNIDKPAGPTSHDIVARIRRLAGTRQVGHSGTLDPDATGVLVVAVGKGTRALPYLNDSGKTYSAWLLPGSSTDTQDASGTVTEQTESFLITREHLLASLQQFMGEIQQIPPMYSAVKINGRKLYEAARQGRVIDRPPRKVTITRIELLSPEPVWGPGDIIRLLVDCSSGTYIRTLCHDLGETLGTHAHMTRLLRVRAGDFSLEQAYPLEQLEKNPELLPSALIPLNQALRHLPEVRIPPALCLKVMNGNKVSSECPAAGDLVRLLSDEGEILAIARRESSENKHFWQPVRVFR